MVYLIIGILILLFYLFAAPKSIRGTLNVVTLVVLLVSLVILLCLAIFQIFQLPSEFFVGAFLVFMKEGEEVIFVRCCFFCCLKAF